MWTSPLRAYLVSGAAVIVPAARIPRAPAATAPAGPPPRVPRGCGRRPRGDEARDAGRGGGGRSAGAGAGGQVVDGPLGSRAAPAPTAAAHRWGQARAPTRPAPHARV